jgi:hypothetical protein
MSENKVLFIEDTIINGIISLFASWMNDSVILNKVF